MALFPVGAMALADDPLPVSLPFPSASVAAGFPSPAADHEEDALDLGRRFITRPSSTFILKASGESLSGIGILPGDFLVVDRSRTPRDRDVVIALIDGAFTAKIYTKDRDNITLLPANPAYRPIPWSDGCEIWGTVTSIHRDLLSAVR